MILNRMMKHSLPIRLIAVVAIALALDPNSAQAQIVNGSFETGDYTGWTLTESTFSACGGTWGIAFNGQTISPGEATFDFSDGVSCTQRFFGLPITYTATDGNLVAYHLQRFGGTFRMFQTVTIPSNATTLSWDMQYKNYLSFFSSGGSKQNIRVTIRNPVTDSILATLFVTTQGVNPLSIPMTGFSADISSFAGSTVRISAEINVGRLFIDATFDNFRLDGGAEPNQPPACEGSAFRLFVNIGDAFSTTVTGSDPDDDDLTVSTPDLPAGAVVSPASGASPLTINLDWTPTVDDVGQHDITVIVSDPAGEESSCSITVVVVNLPPLCDPTNSVFLINVGESLSHTVTGTDPDPGDILTISHLALPSGASLSPPAGSTGGSPMNATFEWTPSVNDVGQHEVTIIFTDQSGDQDICVIVICVLNRVPICSPESGTFVLQIGETLTTTITGTDADLGDTLTVSHNGLPAGATLAPVSGVSPLETTFLWTPTVADTGIHTVILTFTDLNGADTTCSSSITVENLPPTCTADFGPFAPNESGDIIVSVGQTITATLSGTDPDLGDVLTLSSAVLPSGSSLTPAVGASGSAPLQTVFSWGPTATDAPGSPHTLEVVFTDLNGATATCTAPIIVNRPPLCSVVEPLNTPCAGSTTVVQLDGTASSDPDPEDMLTFEWANIDCPGGVFSDSFSDTPTIALESSPGCSQLCSVELTVDDGSGGTDSCTTAISITDDTLPTVSCPADAELECPADTSVAANGSATGADDCGGVAVTLSDSSAASCGGTEQITRTWIAEDDCGNSSACDQTISVVDTTPPALSVDTTSIEVVDADCSGVENVALPPASATDTCDVDPVVVNDAPATFPAAAQPTTVTYTATDSCGNASSNTLNVTVQFGANIEVHAAQHTVGSGSHPGSSKAPLVGIQVCGYDKSEGSCARQQDEQGNGISWQEYAAIVANCESVNCAETDAGGVALINLPPGDYIVIASPFDTDDDGVPDQILGVSASNLQCGQLMKKHLQLLQDANGNKKPGKTTRLTGSELLIIEPEYVLWDNTEQLYPFVFESIGDWGVTTSVAPPEGFVADYETLSEYVDNELGAVQFTITEVGSDLIPTGTTFQVVHKGQTRTVQSKVGIMLTAEYAQSRGFNVEELRSKGLIMQRRTPRAKGGRGAQ